MPARSRRSIPIVGFYLQPAVGGRVLCATRSGAQFAEIENVVAIKIAPFNRYQTLDVVRAVAEAGRDDIALYTGNDDNIVVDLVTPFRLDADGQPHERRIVGGLLGHWAVWTHRAVRAAGAVPGRRARVGRRAGRPAAHGASRSPTPTPRSSTPRNGFAGCIAGLHEVLRRQGLLRGHLVPRSARDAEPRASARRSTRVCRAYPHLNDDAFVREGLDRWLTP